MPERPKRAEAPIISGKILKWGNSYGIRITRKELEEARLRPGQQVRLRIESYGAKISLTALPTFSDPGFDATTMHDEVLGEWRYRRRLRRGRSVK